MVKTGLDQDIVETDSSFTGFAAVYGDNWLAGHWSEPEVHLDLGHHSASSPCEFSPDMDINIRELWPVVAAAHRWGSSWKNKKVRLLTDNTQVQAMVNTGRSAGVRCMWWIRVLFG